MDAQKPSFNQETSEMSPICDSFQVLRSPIMAKEPSRSQTSISPQNQFALALVEEIKALRGQGSNSEVFGTDARFTELIRPKIERQGLDEDFKSSKTAFCRLKHGFAVGFENGTVMVVLPPCSKTLDVFPGEEVTALVPLRDHLVAFTSSSWTFIDSDNLEVRDCDPATVAAFLPVATSITCVASYQEAQELFLGLSNGTVDLLLEFEEIERKWNQERVYNCGIEGISAAVIHAIESEPWVFVQYSGGEPISIIWRREDATILYIFRMRNDEKLPIAANPRCETYFPQWHCSIIVEATCIVIMSIDEGKRWRDRNYIQIKVDKGVVWEVSSEMNKLDYLKYRAKAEEWANFSAEGFTVFLEPIVNRTDWMKQEIDTDPALAASIMRLHTDFAYSEFAVSMDGIYLCLLGENALKVLTIGAIESTLTHSFENSITEVGTNLMFYRRFGGLYDNQKKLCHGKDDLYHKSFVFSPDKSKLALWNSLNETEWRLVDSSDPVAVKIEGESSVRRVIHSEFSDEIVLILKGPLVKVYAPPDPDPKSNLIPQLFTDYFWKRNNRLFAFMKNNAGFVFTIVTDGNTALEEKLDIESNFEQVVDVSGECNDFIFLYSDKTVYFSYEEPLNKREVLETYREIKAFGCGKWCAGLSDKGTLVLQLPEMNTVLRFDWNQKLCISREKMTFLSYCADPLDASFGIVKVWDMNIGIPTNLFDTGLRAYVESLPHIDWSSGILSQPTKNTNTLPADLQDPSNPTIERLWKFALYEPREASSPLVFTGAEAIAAYCAGVKRLSILLSRQKGQIAEIDKVVCQLVVQPCNMNILHFLVIINEGKFILPAFRFSAKFLKSAIGTPIALCYGKSADCLDNLLEALIELQESQPDDFLVALHLMSDEFVQLFHSESAYLVSFLQMILVPLPSEYCKKSLQFETNSLPKPMLRENLFPVSQAELSSLRLGRNRQFQAEFRICPIKLQLYPSEKCDRSLLFVLKETDPMRNILSVEAIHLLAELKWRKVKLWWLLLSALYWTLLAMIVCRIYKYGDQDSISATILAINSLLLFIECVQMYFSGWIIYFKSPWNYLDLVRIALTFPFAVVSMRIWLTFLTVMISAIRGLTTFEAMDYTRFLVKMILKACRETIFFVVVFVYSNICFGVLLKVSQEEMDDTNFFESWKQSFELSMGGFDMSSAKALQWMVFFFASLVNVIWMLNLLISILGTAYDQFTVQIEAEDVKTQFELVYEMEQMLRSVPRSDQYIVVLAEKPKRGNPREEQVTLFALKQEMEGRNKELSDRMGRMEMKLETILQSIKEAASKQRFADFSKS